MQTSDEHRATSDELRSGFDLDVWGDDIAKRMTYVPRLGTDDECVLKTDGVCTCAPGYERCLAAAEEPGASREEHEGKATEDTE